MTARTRVAVLATAAVNGLSRRLGAGSGTVAGGRVGLAISPHALEDLGVDRSVAVVSGTNGKTTTTRLLAAALESNGSPVVTNATGSNMPAGHFAALAAGPRGAAAVLEIDEGYLPATTRSLRPDVTVLLNLSRDQLDRSNEVRMVARRWRDALAEAAGTVVANADDPLVAYGAGSAPSVVWVAGGMRWRADAAGCPACEGRIGFLGDTWSCTCGFSRPVPDVAVEERGEATTAIFADGRRLEVTLAIPGAVQPAQRGDGRRRRRGAGRAGRPRAGRHGQGGGGRRSVLAALGRRGGDPTPAGEEPRGLGRAPRVGWWRDHTGGGRDQRADRRRPRPVVAVGRGVRAPGRPADRRERGAQRGPVCPAPLRRGSTTNGWTTRRRPWGAPRELGSNGAPVEFIGNYTAFHDLLRASPVP